MDKNYNINENATYQTKIRALQEHDLASADEIFNPLFETMINNTHAVKNKIDTLEGKMKWSEYTSLAQLGLTNDDIVTAGTLTIIINAMPSYSRMSLSTNTLTPWQELLPASTGLLVIEKGSDEYRVFLNFMQCRIPGLSGNAIDDNCYSAICYLGELSPWKRFITDTEIADTGWNILELINNATAHTAYYAPRYRKIGKLVELRGAIHTNQAIGSTGVIFAQLPKEYIPSVNVPVRCQGGDGHYTWLLTVQSDGVITASRYGSASLATSMRGDEWMPFQVTYFID